MEFNPLKPEPLVIVISGLSGVGKDSVIKRMMQRQPSFHFVVTVNTRLPRENEVEGVDYFFVSQQEYDRMKKEGELLESAKVYNDYKGVPRRQVEAALASGKDVVMRLDVQGAAAIRALCPEALMIFITTQDEDEMVRRLKKRRSESQEDLQKRIDTAHEELKVLDGFDYLVVNRENQLEQAVDDVLGIIHSEHCRIHPRKVTL
jgi:guanylate kinase